MQPEDVSLQFEKPPLIELVAELKWLPATPGQVQLGALPTMPQPIMATSSHETFFSDFGRESAASGWTASERLLPQGLPILSFQPIYRVRSFKQTESQMMYQVGAGIYSAHALPPYKNWESFRPFAERGLEYLLRSRPTEEREREFFSVTLRYLDLFTPDLIGDMSIGRFLTEVLGFSLGLPAVLTDQLKHGEEAEPSLSLRIPQESGLEMRINIVGGAVVGDKKGIIMDTAVSSQQAVTPHKDTVLAVWEEAHNAIRRTFMRLTAKIQPEMIPIKETI